MNATATDHHAGALEEYSKRKLELAGTVRNLLNFAEQRKDEMVVGDCRRLLARLAEDRFNLAFVGQFSRGKSWLMNATLGAEKLPTGVLPLTSVITTVAYGETECVLLQREGSTLPQEIRLEQLPEYVTQTGNPGNEKKVTLAEIQLPHQLLRLGAHFIDTPGIASAIRANTRATRQFLPEIDAAILVTTFESPFAESELNFLREVRSHARTVFVVVNKQDLVSTDEKDAVVQAIRDELKAAFDDHFELFAVSARDALSAKQAGSHEDLLNSGLPDLEAALVKLLRTRKARELLLRAAECADAIAERQKISIQISEQARSPELARVLNRKLHDFSETHETGAHIRKLLQAKSDSAVWAEIGTILDRLRTFRDAVERMGTVGASDALDSPHTTHSSRRSIVAPCRICLRLERVVWDFMAHAQYELSVRENCQHLHASRSGFCPLHTWRYEAVSSPQGVCAAHPEVLVRFAEQLRTLADHGKSLEAIAEGLRLILPQHSSCKVCGLISSEEQVAADQIAREISVDPAQCPPLCAYHLHAVLAANPETEAATRLLRKEATAFDALAEEMQRFVLKRAAPRHHFTTKSENEPAMAGLARLAGNQRLAGPWRID
jgi:GTP-binding protein EngB required for normal cell division